MKISHHQIEDYPIPVQATAGGFVNDEIPLICGGTSAYGCTNETDPTTVGEFCGRSYFCWQQVYK